MKKKLTKNLIILILVSLMFSSCTPLKNKYNSKNLFDNLSSVNFEQFAKTYASDIFVPDKNNNKVLDNISAGSYYASSFNRNTTNYIYYKDPYKQVPIASLTKLMTLLVVLENEKDLNKIYTVSGEATDLEKNASKANLLVGDKLTVKDLLFGLMLPSGNDAAICLAENLAGSVENFVIMMNNTANNLCAMNTHFQNPHGLSAEFHYSSAYDLYLIIKKLMGYDLFFDITSRRQYETTVTQQDGYERRAVWTNTNFFATGERGISTNVLFEGGKTGYTSDAGECLAIVSKSKKNDEQYITVVLKATSKDNTYRNTNALLGNVDK